jgi:RecA-family ATPase
MLAVVDARLLIIDPLAAFLYGSDANKDQEIRRVLYKLSRMAERRRCSVLCVRHLNKGNGGKALYRGNMSIGVIGHARAGLLVAPAPDDATGRILAVTKCNLAARAGSLRFTLAAAGAVCRVDWNGTSPYHADQLVQAPPSATEKEAREEARTKQQLAEELLRLLLTEGSVTVKRAKAEAAGAGISARVLERAARALKLKVSFRHVEGKRVYAYSAV